MSLPPCSLANIPLTPETQRDQERRIRREIANSNERRRMQSINAGFQSLKTLIPHTDGEKLSKVGAVWESFQEEVVGSSRQKEVSFGRHYQPEPLTCLSHPQAAILQQTAEYIFSLEQEKTRLLQQNTQLKRFIQVAPVEAACHLSALPSFWLPLPGMGVSGPNHWPGTLMWLQVPPSPLTRPLPSLASCQGLSLPIYECSGMALEGTG